jgi:hypothetical protein
MKLIALPPELMAAPAIDRQAKGEVVAALQNAAARTGADFDYLLKTAVRESSLNPDAKAKSSSASGLFQFIEQTWLATVKKHGATMGLGDAAGSISQDGDGRYKIAGKADREAILALRNDPNIAALMAGAMTNDLNEGLSKGLGRAATGGETYAAHFLGLGGALKLIRTAEADPAAKGADLFPAAAKANRSIFYARNGEARAAASIIERLTAKHDAGAPPALRRAIGIQPPDATPPEPAVELAALEHTDLRGSLAGDAASARFNYTASNSYFLTPVLVQILASLDSGPALRGPVSEDQAERRRFI